MRLKITLEDIENGIACDAANCPISLAGMRQFEVDRCDVVPGMPIVIDGDSVEVTKILLNGVEVYYTISEFATNFDLDRTARPCSIEIFEINPRTDAWGRKINE